MPKTTLNEVLDRTRDFYAREHPDTHDTKDYCPFHQLAWDGLDRATSNLGWHYCNPLWLTVMRTGWDVEDNKVLGSSWHSFQWIAPVHQTRVDLTKFKETEKDRLATVEYGSAEVEKINGEIAAELAAELKRIVSLGWGEHRTAPDKADVVADPRAENRYVWIGGYEMISNSKLDWNGLYQLLLDERAMVLRGDAEVLEYLALTYEKAAMYKVKSAMAVTSRMRKAGADAPVASWATGGGGSAAIRKCPDTGRIQAWDESRKQWRNLKFED